MRFWDSSAIVPLLVEEPTSEPLAKLFREEACLVWWATEVECASALARLERMQQITAAETQAAFEQLIRLARSWHSIDPVEEVRSAARRFLRVHELRAADALQLGAIWVAAEGNSESLQVVCLDDRLVQAAQREGFRVIAAPALLAVD